MNKEKRYQVFVSSTYTDLKDERRAVMQTLMEMDCIPAGMELFPALDEDQFEFIKRVVEDCDYYIIILGGRYGSLSESGFSYTELEYDYAVSLGIKVIALVHEEPDLIPAKHVEATEELKQRLADFRQKVMSGRLVRFWKSTDQISGLVALSLSRTIKTYPATGWVRANNLEELSELKQQLKSAHELPAMKTGVSDIYQSRKSLGAYFTEITRTAKSSVLMYFVTGGFIPAVELEEIVADSEDVTFTFLIIDPNSTHRTERGKDTASRFEVGKVGDGYDHLLSAKDRYPDRIRIKTYDHYPFWHYVLVDENELYVSFNPIGKIGFSTSTLYKMRPDKTGDSLFHSHRENLKLIERSAKPWELSADWP